MVVAESDASKAREKFDYKSKRSSGKGVECGKSHTAAFDASQSCQGSERTFSAKSRAGRPASCHGRASLGKERPHFLSLPDSRVGIPRPRSCSLPRVADIDQSNCRRFMRRDSSSSSSSTLTRSSSKGFESSFRSGSKQAILSEELGGHPATHATNSHASVASPRARTLGEFSARLASKYWLPLEEVNHILECWSRMEADEKGFCSIDIFEKMVCAVFRMKQVPCSIVNSAFDATHQLHVVGPKQRINNFVSWYAQHMFASDDRCNVRAKLDSSTAGDYALAYRYNVKTDFVDRVKREFTHLDLERSGTITDKDYQELVGAMKSWDISPPARPRSACC